MRIVFLLGNGFDINLGINTGYQSFYDYYLAQPSGDEAVARLKKELEEKRYTTWADLEIGLGRYTAAVDSVEQMRTVYYDLSDRLQEFLKKKMETFVITEKMTSAIVKGFSYPQSYLPQGMNDAIVSYKRGHYPDIVDIISFNYTDTVERVLQSKLATGYPVQLSPQLSLTSINHIHMRLEDDDVIMGVNDDSQILSKELLNDDMRALLVKPYINQQLQNLIDSRCAELIRNAELICIFGVSLGETDLYWWRLLGQRFTDSNLRIVYYTYDDTNITRNSERIMSYQKSRELLFKRMGIIKPSSGQVNRVYIGHKTAIFKY